MTARRSALYVVTALSVTVSLCTPGTARFVARQLREFLPAPYGPIPLGAGPETVAARLRGAAARLPDDAAAQSAAALAGGDEPAWASVEKRFPARPVALAARISALAEDAEAPGRLDGIAAMARRGERADPGNAYYPAVLFAARLEAGDSAEGLPALRRAAACPRWNDYGGELSEGLDRLVRAAGGPDSGAQRFLIVWPETHRNRAVPALLRAGARDAAEAAAVRERAGRVGEGIGIRHATMAVGAKMRARSSTLGGALGGAAMVAAAAGHPGGAPPAPKGHSTAWQARYLAWLRAAGHGAEAAYAEDQFARNERTRAVARRALDAGYPTRPARRAMCWQVLCVALLAAHLIWLLFWPMIALGRRGARRSVVMLPASVAAAYGAWYVWPASARIGGAFLAAAVALPLMCEVLDALNWQPRRRQTWEPVRFAVPAVCALLTVYFALAPFAARAQRDLDGSARTAAGGEGAYLARQAHLPWPG